MNISRIVLALLLIVGAGGALASGTSAFFSDTETSTGNMFTAGDIDLKIDNDSYYNGNRCTFLGQQATTTPGYYWQGNAEYPVVGSPCETSFPASDLGNGLLFFNFTDVKPDDEGEDTISIHPGSNSAYVCLDMTLTSDDDISSVDPELGDGDVAEDPNNTWDGELADTIQMFWWADDGDNVYEVGENAITNGVQTITDMFGDDKIFTKALADSQNNVWGNQGPVPGNATVYIAKAWCMGTLSLTPVPAGQGVNPQVASGVNCDGTALNNISQTDGTTMDIAFRAIQSRNNPNFVCDETTRLASITVTKQITNDNGGNNIVSDFQLFVVGNVVVPVTSGSSTNIAAGNYTITESGVSGYQASFSGDCNAGGQITVPPGGSASCTITNNDIAPSITLIKNVVGGTAVPVQFTMLIDGNVVPQNTSVAVTANSPHSINEIQLAGYQFTSITGNAKCPAALLGTATLDEGESITCTITNSLNN